MANSPIISNTTTAITALSGLILVDPQDVVGYQPQPLTISDYQPPKLLFHYEGEQTATIDSDITDHFTEDNLTLQDQIALKPETITAHGFIGELNDIIPLPLAALKTVADKLTILGAYSPELTTAALIAYNEAFFVYSIAFNAANAAVAAVSSISGANKENAIGSAGIEGNVFDPITGQISSVQTKQQIAFQQFYGYWRQRRLFTVQTPWAIFKNMAIKSLRAVQSEETKMITDFEVTFKMIRFAKTKSNSITTSDDSGRANQQRSDVINHGTYPASPSISFAEAIA